MATSFLRKLEQYPPVRCRLLAVRYPGNSKYGWPVPLTDEEIALKGGLTVGEVRSLSVQTAWSDIRLWQIRGFMVGCRLNFDNYSSFKRTARLAAREKFHYLRRSPDWATHYEPFVKLWEYVRRA